MLNGPNELDQGSTLAGQANIVPANENSIDRTAAHILNIALANPSTRITREGFFPEGINRRINAR